MIITRKHLSRRTILRGFGASLALPLLDGMVPALSALSQTAARGVRRMAVVYVPNGMMMPDWTPKGDGAAFEFSPILAPLEAYRDKLVVVSGLADKYGWPQGDEGAGDHARASATFLTGVHAKKTEGSDIQAGISMDQIAARTLGQETQLASLELALESVELLGAAMPATAAPMPTPSRGAVRRRRCRWRTIRERCSSGCSAAPTRRMPPRGWHDSNGSEASWIPWPTRSPICAAASVRATTPS